MKFAFAGTDDGRRPDALEREIAATLCARGHEHVPSDANGLQGVDLVFNLTDVERPQAHYLREDASVFVATLLRSAAGDAWSDREALRKAGYAALVKTMSNLVVHRIDGGGHGSAVHYVTPELGFRSQPVRASTAEEIARQVEPLAAARIVAENRLDEDLPGTLWQGDDAVRSLVEHGRRLAALDLLPSVFDLSALLDEQAMRLMRKVFGLKQLSYGNLSVRCDHDTFWMSGRGADKGKLAGVGHDVFLVKGYDAQRPAMLLSVPPGTDADARVSVDAVEHFKIYDALPAVGAIVHVHAWMPGVEATTQSWPCGTEAMADEVLAIVRRQPDPARAVVGLKNHGLTLTGPSLEDIFDRIDGRLTQDVPVLE